MKKTLLLYFLILLCVSCGHHGGSNVYNVVDFGACGDGKTDDAVAIQKAIDKCSANGGGIVLFPSGKTFMSGPIQLKSHVNIHLEPNSKLLANPDEEVYRESAFGENRGEGMMWIWGKNLDNVSFTGTGTIDGNGVSFMGEEQDDYFELKPVTDFDPRPHLMTLIDVRNLKISQLNISNSAYWAVHLVGCYDVAITDVTLLNNLKVRNGDGIDLDHCRKVRISGCFIESGDDGICLKNRREYEEYGPCQDIVVDNCILTSRSCAIKIGSENMDSISRVTFNNCIITDSNRGVGIQNRDEGSVSDITFSNMAIDCRFYSDIWWGKSEPIYITSYPRASVNHKDANWRFPKGATEGKCGPVNNIRFYNISCKSENGIFIGTSSKGLISDIFIDNVSLDIIQKTTYPRGSFDKRPCKGDGFRETEGAGLLAENVDGICLKNFAVKGAAGAKFINCTNIQH